MPFGCQQLSLPTDCHLAHHGRFKLISHNPGEAFLSNAAQEYIQQQLLPVEGSALSGMTIIGISAFYLPASLASFYGAHFLPRPNFWQCGPSGAVMEKLFQECAIRGGGEGVERTNEERKRWRTKLRLQRGQLFQISRDKTLSIGNSKVTGNKITQIVATKICLAALASNIRGNFESR